MTKKSNKYDEKLDKVLAEVKFDIEEKSGFKFEGKIRQYKNGPLKLQISRIVPGEFGHMYSKLGRLDLMDMKCIERMLQWGTERIEHLGKSETSQEEDIENIED